MTDTDALIELLDKATPNWKSVGYCGMSVVGSGPYPRRAILFAHHDEDMPGADADIELAALAPDLAREVIALRAEIARLSSRGEVGNG